MFCVSLSRWIEFEPNLNRIIDGFLAQAATGEGRSCSYVGVASADGRPDREGNGVRHGMAFLPLGDEGGDIRCSGRGDVVVFINRRGCRGEFSRPLLIIY